MEMVKAEGRDKMWHGGGDGVTVILQFRVMVEEVVVCRGRGVIWYDKTGLKLQGWRIRRGVQIIDMEPGYRTKESAE